MSGDRFTRKTRKQFLVKVSEGDLHLTGHSILVPPPAFSTVFVWPLVLKLLSLHSASLLALCPLSVSVLETLVRVGAKEPLGIKKAPLRLTIGWTKGGDCAMVSKADFGVRAEVLKRLTAQPSAPTSGVEKQRRLPTEWKLLRALA